MTRRSTLVPGLLLTAGLAAVAAACGSDASTAGGDDPASRGQDVAIANGCAACHGTDGQGGVGPSFIGLAGTVVELDDGSTVLADQEYLRRSIVDPSAQIRPGWTVNMPQRTFQEGEVDLLVAWIESLGDGG